MSNTCRMCAGSAQYLWSGALLNHQVKYFECVECGYVQTEEPFWLDQAYANPINDMDTGIMERNYDNVSRIISALWMLGCVNGRVVDYAGGYGILVRLLRDSGIDAYWMDKYSENLLARGFEDHGGAAQLVTSFESFEHFVDPVAELKAMLAKAPSVLLSTTLIPSPTPDLDQWWYYGSNHGQHIGFFRRASLEKMASMVGKNVVTDGCSYHLFTDQVIGAWKWKKLIRKGGVIRKLLADRLKSKTRDDFEVINKMIG